MPADPAAPHLDLDAPAEPAEGAGTGAPRPIALKSLRGGITNIASASSRSQLTTCRSGCVSGRKSIVPAWVLPPWQTLPPPSKAV